LTRNVVFAPHQRLQLQDLASSYVQNPVSEQAAYNDIGNDQVLLAKYLLLLAWNILNVRFV